MNIQMTRGDTALFEVRIVDDDGPLNLAGKGITFSAKRSVSDSVPLFSKSVGSGITITDAAAGIAEVKVSPADTESLRPFSQQLVYDVQLTDGGDVYTVVQGMLTVNPDVTR